MTKKDLEFILAYAECYGLRNKSVVGVYNIIKHDADIDDTMQYYDIDIDAYIDSFLDTYKAIKILGFEAECFTLMKSGYTIWMAAENWNIPFHAKEAAEYIMQ